MKNLKKSHIKLIEKGYRKWERWTKEEIEFLKKNYKKLSNKVISKQLRRTVKAVSAKATRIGLRKDVKISKKELMNFYWNEKLTLKDIGKICNLTAPAIRYYMIKFGIPRRERNERRRLRNKNLSKELGYVLGVINGDGSIRGDRKKQIVLTVKDRIFAETFKKVLDKWTGYDSHFSFSKKIGYKVELGHWEASRFLQSFDLKRLSNIPEWVKCAFLRGLFDSDGSVYASNLDDLRRASRCVNFYNSDKNLIDIVSKLLNELNIKHKIYMRHRSGFGSTKPQYTISIFGRKNITKFLEKIGFTPGIKQVKGKNLNITKQEKLMELLNSYQKPKYTDEDRKRVIELKMRLEKESLEKVKKAIKLRKMGLSYNKIAKIIGVSKRIISNWERNIHRPIIGSVKLSHLTKVPNSTIQSWVYKRGEVDGKIGLGVPEMR